MDINSVSSNKVVLKIRTPQGGEVPLNKGEVLPTQVQDVGEDGQVTIVVKGKLIEAFTEVPVKPGQQLLLMVDDVRNGKTYLKVVTPEMMGKIENTNISANLLEMGIAAKEDTILLSRKLLKYNMPVNQNNLNELSKNTTLLGGMNARNLEIAAFALSRGITGKTALESLAQFLAPQSDPAKLISVLGSVLDAINSPQSASVEDNLPTAQNKPLFTQVQSEAGKNLRQAASPNQADPVQGSKIEETKLFGRPNNISTSPAGVIAHDTVEPIVRNVVSGPSKAADVLFTLRHATSGNLNQPAASQPHLSINTVEEAFNSNAQLKPSAGKMVSDEEGLNPRQTNLADGNSPADKVKMDAPNTREVIRSGNTLNVKITGQGSAGLVSDDIPEAAAQEKLPGDKRPVAEQNLLSDNSKIRNEASLKNSAPAINRQTGEMISVTQGERTIPQPKTENVSGPMTVPFNDEGMGEEPSLKTASPIPIGEGETTFSRDSLSRNISNVLDTLRNLMEINPEDPPDKIAGKIQEAISNEKDIIKALTLLKDIADNQDISEKLPRLKEFALRLNSLEKEITGQQLYNISSKNSPENISSYYFSFPVPIDQGYHLCQLKIDKDSRQRLRDVDKLSLVVSLNTARLGLVLYHVNWHKAGQIELQGVVENQASCDYLNKSNGELVKSLEALGYRVKNQGVKVISSPEEIRSLKPVLQEVNERLRPLGIDVTV